REFLEVRHVLAVSSGTAALHLSLVALGVGPGDEVITSSITWPATANVIVHCGATPVFADVREDTLNIDPERAAELVGARYKANVSDVLASIALVQLDKIEHHAEIRRRQVELYDDGLAGLDGVTPIARDPRDIHANHLYVVRVSFADRDQVQRALAEENIGTSMHFLPVHTLRGYRDRRAPHQPALP